VPLPLAGQPAMPAHWRDFYALTKPRVMSLVVFTGLCGLLAAPGHIHPVLGFTAILCIALAAGGAAALNQWWEADLDKGMKRTAARPLPSGRFYLKREACIGCNGVVVASKVERDQLERLDRLRERRETVHAAMNGKPRWA